MSIIDMLDIELDKRELITLVGAGGKTTTMFTLAEELKLLGKKVLVTTTTAIFYPHRHQYDDIVISTSYSRSLFLGTEYIGIGNHMPKAVTPQSWVVVFGREVNAEGKLLGASKEDIDKIFKESLFDFILVEGDGSRGKPIKAPAQYEPVIPTMTTKVLGIIGIDALGKKVNSEYVHRPEIFCIITKSSGEDIVNIENITELIINKNGLYKEAPLGCKKYLMFTKVDNEKDLGVIEEIGKRIKKIFKGENIKGSIEIEKVCVSPRIGGN